MLSLTISRQAATREELADFLRGIANDLDEHDMDAGPDWALSGQEERPEPQANITLHYEQRSDRWELHCEAHGLIDSGDGENANEHDRLVVLGTQHEQSEHGGDGIIPHGMLINRERS